MIRALRRSAAPIAVGLIVLGLWQAACEALHIPRILLPAPTAIAAAFAVNLPLLGADFVQTVVRSMLPGFLIGSGAGFIVGLLVDASPFLRRGVLPVGSLAGSLPIVGIAPIMVMWFGFDWQSKAAVAAVMTFFPMLINTVAGLEAPATMERDLMRSYNASSAQTLEKLRLPAALPYIFTALKLNTTLALIGAIVAEFFGTPTVGMGFRISTEAARLDLDVVWAETFVAAVTGSALFFGLAYLERLVTFWRPAFQSGTEKEMR